MAIGPDGVGARRASRRAWYEAEARELEEAFDSILEARMPAPPGEPIRLEVRGNDLAPVLAIVAERYRAAGWRRVRVEMVREGEPVGECADHARVLLDP